LRLQELADSLTARDLLKCGQKWLAAFTPFITDQERKQAGCQHRLFFSQVEYCDNLIFHRRAAVDEVTQRLLDLNRNIGQPNKITTIFGRKVTKEYKGKLQSVIEDLDLPNPVIRSHYGHGFAKLFRMSALRAGAAMKTKRGIDTVAKLASEGGAREVETSLERLRPTSCLTGNAEKQKSVCGKACQRQRQHGRVHFMESVKRSVPILK